MQASTTILQQLRKLSRRARLFRAVLYALRFFVFGLLLVIPFLTLRSLLLFPASILLGVAGSLALLGACYGALAPLPLIEVAKLADTRLHLRERLATAVEYDEQKKRGELVEALLRDAARVAQTISPRQVFSFHLHGEGKVFQFLLALVVAILILPPVTFPLRQSGVAGKESPPPSVVQKQERVRELKVVQRPILVAKEPLQQKTWGEPLTRYQDTKLSPLRPDFEAFLQGVTEHLRLSLKEAISAQVKGKGSASDHDMTLPPVPSRVGEGLSAPKLGRPSGEELQRLFEAVSHFGEGSKGEGSSGTFTPTARPPRGQEPPEGIGQLGTGTFEGKDAPGGRGGESLEAVRSGHKVPSGEEEVEGRGEEAEQKAGTLLGRSRSPRVHGRTVGSFPDEETQEFVEAPAKGFSPGLTAKERGRPGEALSGGEAEGSLPGLSRSLQAKGAPTPRLEGSKADTSLTSEMEAYKTSLPGLGAQTPSRLSAQDLLTRYRRVMEETFGREAIPFVYREQVKDYFMSLERQ